MENAFETDFEVDMSLLNLIDANSGDDQRPQPAPRSPQALRRFDVALALLLMALGLLPAALLLCFGRVRSVAVHHGGRSFAQYFYEPSIRWGTVHSQDSALCAWPMVFNVLKGDMTWIGPTVAGKTLPQGASSADQSPALGLTNPWALRRRTGVNLGSEHEVLADYQAQRSLSKDLALLLRAALVLALPKAPDHAAAKVTLGDVQMDNLTMEDAIASIERFLDDDAGTRQVCFVNPACVNIAAGNKSYRRILRQATLVLADGIGLKIAGDILRTPIRQNVNGTDLFPRLCEMLNRRGGSIFLLGGQDGIETAVARHIEQHWPRVRIVGKRHGFFSAVQEACLAEEIRDSKADILLVARGVPMQDEFIDRYREVLGVKVALGVGGLFDFVSGRIARAPVWMREIGLEWIFRLMQEPRRMFGRYIVGNVTFLLRIFLQRLGLRKPKQDPDAVQTFAQGQGVNSDDASNHLRAVLIATEKAPADIPVAEDFPLGLLPLGAGTLVSQIMTQLVVAGVREVDVVVSFAPELFREELGDGSRWGVRLNWLLAKDAERPYDFLHSRYADSTNQILLGHVDTWLNSTHLAHLLKHQNAAMQHAEGGGLTWTGWAVIDGSLLRGTSPFTERSELEAALRFKHQAVHLISDDGLLHIRSAIDLFEAQRHCFDLTKELRPSATWIRKPWGIHSTDAYISPKATLHYPVLIGPGCMVQGGTDIGPNVVLCKNVIVASDTLVRDSLVLKDSLIGSNLSLEHMIVSKEHLHNFQLDVRTSVSLDDSIMLGVNQVRCNFGALVSQTLAALMVLLLGLPALFLMVFRGALSLPALWSTSPVVVGRCARTKRLQIETVRTPSTEMNGTAKWLGLLGPVIDVMEGKREWIGVRPRSENEWHAIRRDWQNILLGKPIGVMFAKSFETLPGDFASCRDIADVYLASQTPSFKWLRLWGNLQARP
jgi:N-acetylglucosaminyldiphosphoundecaprenol N-acetyl-beta-D-mannosaminyltransferase